MPPGPYSNYGLWCHQRSIRNASLPKWGKVVKKNDFIWRAIEDERFSEIKVKISIKCRFLLTLFGYKREFFLGIFKILWIFFPNAQKLAMVPYFVK